MPTFGPSSKAREVALYDYGRSCAKKTNKVNKEYFPEQGGYWADIDIQDTVEIRS